MVTVVAAIVAVIGSLVGVVIGGWLTSWLQSRAEIRKIFFDAISAMAQVEAAQNWLITSVPMGLEGREANTELSRRMLDEFVTAVPEARRALAIASAFCPELRDYVNSWPEAFQSAEDRAAIEMLLKSGIRRITTRRRYR
jgi:hypothetical protein